MNIHSLMLSAALVCGLGIAACDSPEPAAPPAPPPPPSPPSPELPMTPVKARQIIGDLPLPCVQLATLKMEMTTCEERQGRTTDHDALRTELRDLRWNLQALPRDQASTQCTATVAELRKRSKPAVCWDLGVS